MKPSNSDAAANLEDRHKREEEYHDLKNQAKINKPGHYQFNPTYRVFLKMKDKIKLDPAKTILECGCGTGWITAEMAATGATVSSFDISGEAVEKTNELLKRLQLDDRCNVKKMAAEYLDYPDNSFDYVIGFAILHHLNLDISIPELHRVLKPGGTAIFAEPLGDNPFINLYRKMTPEYRTPDESPLHIKEFKNSVTCFSEIRHEEFFLTALFPIALSYLPFMKKCIQPLFDFFMPLDEKILAKFPSLGRMSWYSIIQLKK
jgi:SAM-dependent methyltransferase